MDWQCGIDAIAHSEVVRTTGRTIAVLGSGLDNVFPEENIPLFYDIIENGGLILTEYDLGVIATKKNFPKRNRILSGLSNGTLVVESGYRSGANLTANIAINQSRKAFCIPCNLDSRYSGTNELIRKGVKPISSVEQILAACEISVENDILEMKMKKIEGYSKINVPIEYEHVYKVLTNEAKHINKISLEVKENISKITAILTLLELEGLVQQMPGNMFRKEG